jgi:hypothetical protein
LILPVSIAKEEGSFEPVALEECLWHFFQGEVEAPCPKCNRQTQDWKFSPLAW